MLRNKRKIQALKLLEWGKYYQASSLASILKISRNSASNLLRRLWKQGLVARKKKNNKIVYRIKQKGLKRLRYLKRQRIERLKRGII